MSSESNAAFDSFFWSYDAFNLLNQVNPDIRWQRARDAIRVNTIRGSEVVNIGSWYKKEDNPEPLTFAGSQVIIVNNPNGFTLARETVANKRNYLRVNVAAAPANAFPSCEVQNFAVQVGMQNNSEVRVEYAHSNNTLLKVVLSTNPDAFNFSSLYQADMLAPGSGTPRNKVFKASEFIRWKTPDTVWYPTNADTPIFTYSGLGGSSSAVREEVSVDGSNPVVWKLTMNKDSGFAGGGFVMVDTKPVRPPLIKYRHVGDDMILRLQDNDNIFWDCTITPTNWISRKFNWSDFDYSSTNTGSQNGREPSVEGSIKQIEFVAEGESTTYFWYATVKDEPESLPTPVMVYKASVVDTDTNNHTFWVGDFKPTNSTSDVLNYNPGVVPFTVNIINNAIDAWRGIPMAGYQDPSFWKKIGLYDRARQAEQFLSDAQDAYQAQNANGTDGLFAPAYSWSYWDGGDYLSNGLNRFGWSAPDPNSRWQPYNLRAIAATAEAWFIEPSDALARRVTMRALNFLDRDYIKRASIQPLTDSPPIVDPQANYNEPHCAALILRAAMYANLAGGNSEVTFRLIKKSLEFISSQYIATGVMLGSWAGGQPIFDSIYREYFGFWHMEIMDSLALILLYKAQIRYPGCNTAFL